MGEQWFHSPLLSRCSSDVLSELMMAKGSIEGRKQLYFDN